MNRKKLFIEIFLVKLILSIPSTLLLDYLMSDLFSSSLLISIGISVIIAWILTYLLLDKYGNINTKTGSLKSEVRMDIENILDRNDFIEEKKDELEKMINIRNIFKIYEHKFKKFLLKRYESKVKTRK